MNRSHRMPFGAERCDDGSLRFRLWAPKARGVCLYLEKEATRLPMTTLDGGWFELITEDPKIGDRYLYSITDSAGKELRVPDPASRFQPTDVHGPSEIIDPKAFDWSDENWKGCSWEEAVSYELHVGAFTPEGTFAAVEKRLDYLADIGITAIELMPLSDFPGKRNWGYDGVLPYAPDASYGRPEDLKRLLQSAHEKGLMVFLDVVYNHFGPDGNYLPAYAPEFFTDRHSTPWGEAINFDGPGSRTVRDFFIHNALYWLEEYGFDGLRFDAVHVIKDDSNPHILVELAETVRETIGPDRQIHLILENGDNIAKYLRRGQEGEVLWYDAQWNDDIHHAMHVILTGEGDGYYRDYAVQPIRHLGRCLAEGFAFQGDFSEYHGEKRGEPSEHLPPLCFVNFLQNHDQIGNRALGERIIKLTSQEALKAALAILLLAPSPPLLFMGEEFGADTPFLFFCDFSGDLATAVTNGRRDEFSKFEKFSSPEMRTQIPDPNSEETFERSRLDWHTVTEKIHQDWLDFYRELLRIRKTRVVPHLQHAKGGSAKFKVSDKNGLSVYWQLGDNTSLTLLANFGTGRVGGIRRPPGELIYTNVPNPVALRDGLPRWCVAWFLRR
jgi:malto-oligosyltrehalose trehalohydrolase